MLYFLEGEYLDKLVIILMHGRVVYFPTYLFFSIIYLNQYVLAQGFGKGGFILKLLLACRSPPSHYVFS